MYLLDAFRFVVISLAGMTSTNSDVVDPDDASASITINRDGTMAGTLSGAGTEAGSGFSSTPWISPNNATVGDAYWVRCTRTAGATDPTGSAMSSWLQLSSNRSWTKTRSTAGANSCTLTFEIATDAAGANIVATRTGISLGAVVE